MKKIFVLTGEPSGDKLASTLISKLKLEYPEIEYPKVMTQNGSQECSYYFVHLI